MLVQMLMMDRLVEFATLMRFSLRFTTEDAILLLQCVEHPHSSVASRIKEHAAINDILVSIDANFEVCAIGWVELKARVVLSIGHRRNLQELCLLELLAR